MVVLGEDGDDDDDDGEMMMMMMMRAAIIQASDIATGNKRLNLAFCAQIFNTNHGMNMTEESAKVFESQGVYGV